MARRILALASLALLVMSAIAAPALVQAGGGCHGDGNGGSVYMEGDGTTVIRMDVCSFAPTVSRVPVGTTVRFLNTATIDHAVVGRLATWGSEVLSPGKEYSQRFDAAGTYPYTCPLHAGMVGAIVVGGDPIADVAATEPAESAPDPTRVALVGFAGLCLGTVLGLAVALLGRRTTA
jgi:plastocyanin